MRTANQWKHLTEGTMKVPALTPLVKQTQVVKPNNVNRSRAKSFPFGNPQSHQRPAGYQPSISNLRVTLKYDRRHPLSKVDRLIDRRPRLPIGALRLHRVLNPSFRSDRSVDEHINSHTIKAAISSLVPFINGCVDHQKYQKFFVSLRKTSQYVHRYVQLSSKIKESYHQSVIQCYHILHQRLLDCSNIISHADAVDHSETFNYSRHRSAYTRLTTLAIRSMIVMRPSDPSLTQTIYQTLVAYQSINQSNHSDASIPPYCEYAKHLCATDQYDAALQLAEASVHPALIQSVIEGLAHRNQMSRIVETIHRFSHFLRDLPTFHCAFRSLVYSSKASKSTGICSATRGAHSAASTLSGWATQIWLAMESAGVRPTAYTYSLLCHPAYHSSGGSVSTLVHAAVSDRRIGLTDQLVMHLSLRCAEFGQWNEIMSLLSSVQYRRGTSHSCVLHDSARKYTVEHQPLGTRWQELISAQPAASDLLSMSDALGALQSELKFYAKRSSQRQRGVAGSQTFNAIARALAAPSFHFISTTGGAEVPPLALFSQISQIAFSEGHCFTYHTLIAMISRCGDWNESELMWQLYKQARSIHLIQPNVSQTNLFVALIHAASCMDSSVQLQSVTKLLIIHERSSRLTRRVFVLLIRAYLKRSDYSGLFDALTLFRQQHFFTSRLERFAYACVVASLRKHPAIFPFLVRHMFVVCQRPFSKRELDSVGEHWRVRVEEINLLQGEQGLDRAIAALIM